jgi:hypothetical protein
MTPDQDVGLIIRPASIWRSLFGVAGQVLPHDSSPVIGLRTTSGEQGAMAAFAAPGRLGSTPVGWAAIQAVPPTTLHQTPHQRKQNHDQ